MIKEAWKYAKATADRRSIVLKNFKFLLFYEGNMVFPPLLPGSGFLLREIYGVTSIG